MKTDLTIFLAEDDADDVLFFKKAMADPFVKC